MRPALNTAQGRPFNTQAGCTVSRKTGKNVRGPSAVAPGNNKRVADLSVADDLADLMGGKP
jgi:hypothetical protein